ncbi:hypothetical protein DFJ73DRAFT_70447 [Zopfochytrium polystomum]|nr:hypothetical protein DFJ73DRAFT_70447 [Zopfochytrium polystomum]
MMMQRAASSVVRAASSPRVVALSPRPVASLQPKVASIWHCHFITPSSLSDPGTRVRSRLGHGLAVPYTHNPITAFENGIPVEQVRDLHPVEKKWDFWTTSDAFLGVKPTLGGYSHVPYGEAWVLTSGKVLSEGSHFLSPFSKIKAVKNIHPVSFGVVSPTISTKDGVSVNAYAVVYIQVTDPSRSATYLDPETNAYDSERAAARIVKKHLEQFIPSISVGGSSSLSSTDVSALKDKISAALKSKAEEFGLDVLSIEIRGAFPSSLNVADKLRALDPPPLLPTQAGHGLANDYWAEVLSPPFFQKMKFGSNKEVVTPRRRDPRVVDPVPTGLPPLQRDPQDDRRNSRQRDEGPGRSRALRAP